MLPSYDRASSNDSRLLTVGASALVLGLALGALAILLTNGEGQALKAGAARTVSDWHDRTLDFLRAGREKIERATDRA